MHSADCLSLCSQTIYLQTQSIQFEIIMKAFVLIHSHVAHLSRFRSEVKQTEHFTNTLSSSRGVSSVGIPDLKVKT